MTMHIDFACRKNCWNMVDTYGFMRCVGCGACSKDKKTRYEARLECLRRWLKEREEFDDWDDEWREIQERNIAADIAYYKKQIQCYEKKLKNLNEADGGKGHAEDNNAVCDQAGRAVSDGVHEPEG